MSLGETLWTLINKQAPNYVLAPKQHYSFPSHPLHPPRCCRRRQESVLAARAPHAAAQRWRGSVAGSAVAAALLLPPGLRLPRDGDSAREAQVNPPGAPALGIPRCGLGRSPPDRAQQGQEDEPRQDPRGRRPSSAGSPAPLPWMGTSRVSARPGDPLPPQRGERRPAGSRDPGPPALLHPVLSDLQVTRRRPSGQEHRTHVCGQQVPFLYPGSFLMASNGNV